MAKSFEEWVNHYDGNEAGMTIRDVVGDPDVLRWMNMTWDKSKESKSCQHRIVDARNKVVKSGYMCIDCGMLFSAYGDQPVQPVTEEFMDITDMLKLESMTPVEGCDEIYKHYATTFGRTPDAFMAKVVGETKQRLMMWWGYHRETIRAALEAYDPEATSQPVQSWLKDGEIAKVINDLRYVALKFQGTQQLRERIAHIVVPLLKRVSRPIHTQVTKPFIITDMEKQFPDMANALSLWGAARQPDECVQSYERVEKELEKIVNHEVRLAAQPTKDTR